jgi:hypothetical protein
MEDAGNVWRGDDHGKSRAFVRAAVEVSLTHPVFIPFVFGSGGNIVLAQFHDRKIQLDGKNKKNSPDGELLSFKMNVL